MVAGLDVVRAQLMATIATTGAPGGLRSSARPLFVRLTLVLLGALVVAACAPRDLPGADSFEVRRDSLRVDSIARARQDSIARASPGYVVDSLLAPEEEARRFRNAFPGDSATALADGESSRDALVRRFVRSLADADTADLRRLVVGGREFVDLYYPGSPFAAGPYRQPVGFAWRTIQDPSGVGFTRLLRRLGGRPMTFVWQRCDPRIQREGNVNRYTGCTVRLVDERGDSATRRLFGSIVSHRGQFKFLSYTNDM